jgi:predicted permease
MSWIDALRAHMRPLVSRRRADRELGEEFAFHLEQERAKRIARGLPPDEADRQARVAFGGEERHREAMRDEWSGPLSGIGGDVRNGVRRLRRSPGFAVAALLTLALGIGANTAIFTLVRAVLLEPLPYGNAGSLVLIWDGGGDQATDTWMSEREIVEYRRATGSFTQLAAYTVFNANLSEGEPERVSAASVTPNIFATLGTLPRLGRPLDARDAVDGSDDAVVIGHGLWQRRFGGTADVVGRTIRVNGRPRTVVGIMPPDFRLPLDYRGARHTELWVPNVIDEANELPWGNRSYFIVGHLAPGVTPEQATSDIERAWAAWDAQGLVDGEATPARRAIPLDDLLLRDVRPALLVLFAAVGLILLLACANVAHLHLARADARRRELATQIALGASGLRVARERLVESGILAIAGAALGIAIAWAGIRLTMIAAPVHVIRLRDVSIDPAVLAFTAVLIVTVTLLTGLWPALQAGRMRVGAAMAGARGDITTVRRGFRRALIVAETALCLVPVLGAVLLARSFAELRSIDLGFSAESVLTARVDLPRATYGDSGVAETFFRRLTERASAMPGVASAGAVRILPLSSSIGEWSLTFENPGYAGEIPNPSADWQVVTPGYLESVGIAVERGRTLRPSDDAGAPLVAVANETMAQRYWPGQDALGKRFHLGTLNQPWVTIVGVTRDVRRNSLTEEPRAEMYLPHEQFRTMKNGGFAQLGMTLVMRTAGDPLALAPAVRAAVRELDPALPVSEIRTFDAVVDESLAASRFATLLLGGLAALSVALAAIGLYGVLSFTTARRSREIGIRVALGARRASVTGLIMREGVVTGAFGIAIGLLGSFWLTRYLEAQLYGVSRLDPITYVVVPLFLLCVAALASFLPARRAARASPMTALRVD